MSINDKLPLEGKNLASGGPYFQVRSATVVFRDRINGGDRMLQIETVRAGQINHESTEIGYSTPMRHVYRVWLEFDQWDARLVDVEEQPWTKDGPTGLFVPNRTFAVIDPAQLDRPYRGQGYRDLEV